MQLSRGTEGVGVWGSRVRFVCCVGTPTFTGYPLSSNPESCPQPSAFFLSPPLSEMLSGVETVLFCIVYCVYIIVSHWFSVCEYISPLIFSLCLTLYLLSLSLCQPQVSFQVCSLCCKAGYNARLACQTKPNANISKKKRKENFGHVHFIDPCLL